MEVNYKMYVIEREYSQIVRGWRDHDEYSCLGCTSRHQSRYVGSDFEVFGDVSGGMVLQYPKLGKRM